MAKINGIENMSGLELAVELEKGGGFVIYEYAISIVIMTFYRSSAITFVRADDNRIVKGLVYTLLTIVLGWWGIPWGPIRSIQALITNFKGGKDVTGEVTASLKRAAANQTQQALREV